MGSVHQPAPKCRTVQRVLNAVRIQDFKSYEKARLVLAPLTVLIGANASGKSNAIEALRLLSWIAQGNRLGAIRYAVYEKNEAVRGTTASLSRFSGDTFTIGADIGLINASYSITLERAPDDDLHIAHEKLVTSQSSVPTYEVVVGSAGPGSDLRVAYNNYARGGTKPQVTCTDQMAILVQLQSSARFAAGNKSAQTQIPRICSDCQSILSSVLFLDPQPSLMRAYSFKSESRLQGDGSNLSGVLYNLCANDDGRSAVVKIIQSLPEQNISSIDFIETPRQEVMVQLEETFGGTKRKFDATLLSDGTLRVLSIAASILSAPENSLVVIEEIDNGVHPSRAESLLASISQIAKSRNLRVLIISHNPALLDALPMDAVPNVVFCYRDPENGSSKLVRLVDVPDYPELIAQGSVGHLMTKGLIERFVKEHPGPFFKKAARQELARET